MIVDSEEIIKNKPKDCKLCPKSLCEDMSTTGILHIYNCRNDIAIYPPCVRKNGFEILISGYLSFIPQPKYASLIDAIDAIIESPVCELEEALQLTKIKNMI